MSRLKDVGFWKMIFAITIPIAVQNLISLMVNMFDTIMLGKLGEVELAAANLANQPFFIFTLVVFGLSGGALVICSQYWGKKEMEPIRSVVSIVVRLSFLIASILTILMFLFPQMFMAVYTNEPEIIEMGAKYLRIVSFSYIFYGISNTFLSTLRSIEIVKISVLVNIITLVANVFFNWVFIFGNLGFAPMGIEGAAISTVISRIIEFCIVMWYVFAYDRKLSMNIKHFITLDIPIFKKFISYSVPVIFNEVVWSLGISYHSMVFGRLGSEIVSANAISGIVQQIATVVIFGLANATAVVIGKSVGQNNLKLVKHRTKKIAICAFSLGIVSASLILFSKDYFIGFYNVSEKTKEIAITMMIAAAGITFVQSLTDTFMVGVLRGAGDTRFALVLEFVTIWCIAIPLGTIGAFVLKLPPYMVYLLLKIDEPIKVIVCLIRIKGNKWIKNLTLN